MKTIFLLLAQYDGRATIPVETVCRDFFSDLSTDKFLRKVSSGEIRLPIMRMYQSQKAAKVVHLNDLAAYIDERRAEALRLSRWADLTDV